MTVWNLDRRKELELLSELIVVVNGLNKGSGFINKIERCIEISGVLNKTRLQPSVRRSFISFIEGIAVEPEKCKWEGPTEISYGVYSHKTSCLSAYFLRPGDLINYKYCPHCSKEIE